MKAEEREEAGIEVPSGVPHLLLPAQTWAENSCEKCGGPTLNKPLHFTQGRRRERKGVLSVWEGVSEGGWDQGGLCSQSQDLISGTRVGCVWGC